MKVRLTLFLILITFISNAQFTIKGVVLDESNEPIPYVNVMVKNTDIGTITDGLGNFSIALKKNRGRIEISFLGYETILEKVSKKTGFLRVILKEEADQLDEILIVSKPKKILKKKENPAYRILKEIWKRKKTNGLKSVKQYQYKKHQTTEIGLNNLDSIFLKDIFKKEYKEVLSQLPFNETGVNYYIPLYVNEIVTNIYGNNNFNKEREDIEAEKTLGIQRNGFVFQRIANTFNEAAFVDLN